MLEKKENFVYPVISISRTGKKLQEACKAQGFTVRDVQELLCLGSNQAVYCWYLGKNLPSVHNMFALHKLLGIPMDDLIVEEPSG